MPTLFVIFGLRFFFYADEHKPIHIHVENGDGRAKINVQPMIRLVYNKGIKPHDIKKSIEIVEIYKDEIIAKWHEFHGE